MADGRPPWMNGRLSTDGRGVDCRPVWHAPAEPIPSDGASSHGWTPERIDYFFAALQLALIKALSDLRNFSLHVSLEHVCVDSSAEDLFCEQFSRLHGDAKERIDEISRVVASMRAGHTSRVDQWIVENLPPRSASSTTSQLGRSPTSSTAVAEPVAEPVREGRSPARSRSRSRPRSSTGSDGPFWVPLHGFRAKEDPYLSPSEMKDSGEAE